MIDNVTVHPEADAMLSSGPYANPWQAVQTIDASTHSVGDVSLYEQKPTSADNSAKGYDIGPLVTTDNRAR